MNYIARVFDDVLEESLRTNGAVYVTGPKWCGKSTTCIRHAKSVHDFGALDSDNSIALAKLSPIEFLRHGERPMLLDEWQVVPRLWDAVKYEVDRSDRLGNFILSSGVTIPEDEIRHTGTGRIARRRMRTMSLFESGEGEHSVSLASLLAGEEVVCFSSLSLMDYARLICRGGWPSAVTRPEAGFSLTRSFFQNLVAMDMFPVGRGRADRSESLAESFLRAYARSVGSSRSVSAIAEDIGTSRPTAYRFMATLENLYVSEDLAAWNPNLRSKTVIRTSPVRHLTDPSISAAALSATPDWLMKDIRTFGLLFEELAVRDIRTYGEAHGAKAYHYRDKAGREADLVLQFPDGRWALIEVKMREQEVVDEAARNLIRLSEDIDELHQPAFLMVVTHGDAGFRREDGVYQIPLGCLRP